MKYLVSLFAALVFVGVGCSSTATPSTTNQSPWQGEWRMKMEQIQSPAGLIVSPVSNKLLVIDASGNLIEDYSQLEGLGGDCVTEGEITSQLVITDNSATVSEGTVEVEPGISCGPGGIASTNAVPRSLTIMDWALQLSGDTITATANFGPSTAEHIYTRQ